jgi:hypothetical protein
VVLAAEQRFGKGKIIVFGDTSSLMNGITAGCHPYVSRLLAYLADRDRSPASSWWQWLGLLAAATLVVLLAIDPRAAHFGIAAVAMGLVLMYCTSRSYRANDLWPDGNHQSPNNLAYIDASHLEAYSRESWRDDGIMGLYLTLMRNGYLALSLPEMTLERLRRARLVVSIAPARPFSKTEREAVKEYVRGGGVFLCTVGYDRAGPIRSFLSELGFRVGAKSWHGEEPIGEPEPLGHFKSPYFDGGDHQARVRFYAGWPVQCDDPNAWIVARYRPDKPLIVIRRFGKGRIAVVGDTCFAMNKNLEHRGGEPFDGLRENADFWRWFLASLGGSEPWYPPKPGGSS